MSQLVLSCNTFGFFSYRVPEQIKTNAVKIELFILLNYSRYIGQMHSFISKLPLELEQVIMSFLIPDPANISYRSYAVNQYSNSYYNPKYEKAFTEDYLVKNDKGLYLSRIAKKNGKHRFYITQEFVDVIEVGYYGGSASNYMYEYSSTYVGKNIQKALMTLYYGLI